MMIHTRICDLLGITHPIVLGGMGSATSASLVAAVSNSGGLGTHESPIHANHRQAIVRSTGHDTVLTEIPDIATGQIWPGAMARALRNGFIERWAGREWALRRCYHEAGKAALEARSAGDTDNSPILIGQDAGLIDSVRPAGEIVQKMVAEAEEIIKGRLARFLQAS